jgi:hypothetical protein
MYPLKRETKEAQKYTDDFPTVTGMRFAMMQMKTGLINVLSRFEVATCTKTPIPIKIYPKPFLLQSEGEIPLVFKRVKALN